MSLLSFLFQHAIAGMMQKKIFSGRRHSTLSNTVYRHSFHETVLSFGVHRQNTLEDTGLPPFHPSDLLKGETPSRCSVDPLRMTLHLAEINNSLEDLSLLFLEGHDGAHFRKNKTNNTVIPTQRNSFSMDS